MSGAQLVVGLRLAHACAMDYRVVAEAESNEVLPVVRHWFTAGVHVLGSDAGCDWCLPLAGVSRRHLEVQVFADGGYLLRDLDSRNGTRAQGQRIRELATDAPLRVELGPLVIVFAPAAAGAQILLDLAATPASRGSAKEPAAATTIAADRWRRLILALDEAVQRGSGLGRGLRLQLLGDALVAQGFFAGLRITADVEDAAVVLADCGVLDGAVHGQRAGLHLAWTVGPMAPDAPLVEALLGLIARLSDRVVDTGGGGGATASAEVALITSDAMFAQSLRALGKVAPSSLTVLLTGESGSGKDVVARWVHAQSDCRDAAFVAWNCAAIPKDLIEAELFGIERGVATGVSERVGILERARGGTVFLDEIGELPVDLQAKLLRAVEAREVFRVGARTATAIDVRFIAATNQALDAAVREGRFRLDLFHRLAGFEFEVPPLRARRTDVIRLTRAFLEEATAALGRSCPGVTEAALAALLEYSWPGNVRELRNEMQRAALQLEPGEPFDLRHLGARVRTPASTQPLTLDAALLRAERDALGCALELARGDLDRVQALLGIGRSTLYRKLKEHGFAA
ncbi:MAG: sigma 54-interacting transcriptional regulator [Xanthomonadales bacterium]|nr:sigma 54-interacting transcriptional regulator [Xanthomonadales bacterium]